jgi:hypothetical protein
MRLLFFINMRNEEADDTTGVGAIAAAPINILGDQIDQTCTGHRSALEYVYIRGATHERMAGKPQIPSKLALKQ